MNDRKLNPNKNSQPWLIWIYTNEILNAFNVAPRLEITSEMRRLGWKVDLIAPGPTGKHTIQGVEITCFHQPNIFLVRNLVFHFQVIRYIFLNRKLINFVMFSQLSALWILPLRLLKITGGQSPILVMDTRTVPMEAVDKATIRDKLRGQYTLLMSKIANWLAEGHTAITQRMADRLSIPQDKLWGIWSSGVNSDKFNPSFNKRVWPGEQDPVIVIYMGTLNYERNLMALCQAIVRANQNGMNFVLWLYGSGNEKADLQAFAEKMSGDIKIFDVVPNENMPEVLARAHVGSLPFPDEEKYRVSSPIKLFEYMGAGMPIIATKIFCHTDVVGDGNYAFWAENSNTDGLLEALKKVWQERSQLKTLGTKALTASREWTWSASAKRLDGALRHGLTLHEKE